MIDYFNDILDNENDEEEDGDWVDELALFDILDED